MQPPTTSATRSHEPQRWEDASAGFSGAAAALESHATVLEEARATAQWAAQEHARGERVTREGRAAYDADVARARQEAADAAARGQFRQLLIHPFSDPGEAVRRAALDVYADTVARVEASGLNAASAAEGDVSGIRVLPGGQSVAPGGDAGAPGRRTPGHRGGDCAAPADRPARGRRATGTGPLRRS